MAKKKLQKTYRERSVGYNWNEHGYVVQLLYGTNVQHEYKGGNNCHDAHVHVDPHGADKTSLVPVDQIRKAAQQEALEVAKLHRVPRCRVQVDKDLVVWEPEDRYYKEEADGAGCGDLGFDDGWAVYRQSGSEAGPELLAVVDTAGMANSLIWALQNPPRTMRERFQQVLQKSLEALVHGDCRQLTEEFMKQFEQAGVFPKE